MIETGEQATRTQLDPGRIRGTSKLQTRHFSLLFAASLDALNGMRKSGNGMNLVSDGKRLMICTAARGTIRSIEAPG